MCGDVVNLHDFAIVVIDSRGVEYYGSPSRSGMAPSVHSVRQLGGASRPMVALGYLASIAATQQMSGPVEMHTIRLEIGSGAIQFSVLDLISHAVGLRGPTLMDGLRMNANLRERAVVRSWKRAADVSSRMAGVGGCYSEISAWWLLEMSADCHLGGPGQFATYVSNHIQPLMGSEFLFVQPQMELMSLPPDAFGMPTATHRGCQVPVMESVMLRTRRLTSPSLGFYGSVSALARYWHSVGQHYSGTPEAAVSAAIQLPDRSMNVPSDQHGAPAGEYRFGLKKLGSEVSTGPRPRDWYGHDGMGGSIVGGVDRYSGDAFSAVLPNWLSSTFERRKRIDALLWYIDAVLLPAPDKD